MKKFAVIAVLALLAAVFAPGCGKIKVLAPTPPSVDCTDSEITSPYSVCYSFENGTKDGINFDVAGNTAFKTETVATDKAYRGTHSVKIHCKFIGAYGGASGGADVSRQYPQTTNIDMTGKVITAYVWVPAAMFNSSIPYGMFFYVQGYGPGGEWSWFQSSWQNLQMPNPPEDGLWNSITARVDDMMYNGNVTITAANSTRIHQWGLKIGKGNSGPTSAADFTGDMYIDSITVSGDGPTPTPTYTPPALSPTETPVDTVTETPTVTPTITETVVDTPTATVTPTP